MNHPLYNEAFARWSPVFRAKHAKASRTSCDVVKQDVIETIAIWEMDDNANPSYVGKLYAELDAIRDREMVLNKVAK